MMAEEGVEFSAGDKGSADSSGDEVDEVMEEKTGVVERVTVEEEETMTKEEEGAETGTEAGASVVVATMGALGLRFLWMGTSGRDRHWIREFFFIHFYS